MSFTICLWRPLHYLFLMSGFDRFNFVDSYLSFLRLSVFPNFEQQKKRMTGNPNYFGAVWSFNTLVHITNSVWYFSILDLLFMALINFLLVAVSLYKSSEALVLQLQWNIKHHVCASYLWYGFDIDPFPLPFFAM